jgi:hypothetical protein
MPATSCDNLDSYTQHEHGGLQGTDRAVTTYRLPLNQRVANVLPTPMYPGTMPDYTETTHIP